MSDSKGIAAAIAGAGAALVGGGLLWSWLKGRPGLDVDSPLTPEDEAARMDALAQWYRDHARNLSAAAERLTRRAERKQKAARLMALEARAMKQAFAGHVATLTGTAECAACHEPVVKSALVGWGAGRLTCADGAACLDAQRKAEEARRAAP